MLSSTLKGAGTTQHGDTQHNDTEHNKTLHFDAKRNDARHNKVLIECRHLAHEAECH